MSILLALGIIPFWAFVLLTGLELERAETLYAAFVTGDWSQVSTDELRTPKVAPETRLAVFLEKGAKAKLKRQLITSIIVERSKRESVA